MSTSPRSVISSDDCSPEIFWLIDAMLAGAAILASARSKLSTALKNSVSFWSLSTEETVTPSGISKMKRVNVGCTEARTRMAGRFFAASIARWTRSARSAARARSANSLITSGGRLGGAPGQLSGNRSTNSRSPGPLGVVGAPARQRQPDPHAVGIAPCRADIIRHRVCNRVGGNVDRMLEADDENGAGSGDFGPDLVGELYHKPGVSPC